jgi:hypothetical protein
MIVDYSTVKERFASAHEKGVADPIDKFHKK